MIGNRDLLAIISFSIKHFWMPTMCQKLRHIFFVSLHHQTHVLACKMHPFQPTSPKSLTPLSTLKSKVSSKYNLNQVWMKFEVWSVVRQNCFPAVNLWTCSIRQVVCFQIQWWDRHGIDILIPNGGHQKEGVMDSKQVQNLAKQIPLGLTVHGYTIHETLEHRQAKFFATS